MVDDRIKLRLCALVGFGEHAPIPRGGDQELHESERTLPQMRCTEVVRPDLCPDEWGCDYDYSAAGSDVKYKRRERSVKAEEPPPRDSERDEAMNGVPDEKAEAL
mgnify:CR=1 FL=1